jgi:hypothetical protein
MNSAEAIVAEAILQSGPRAAFTQLIAENDSLVHSSDLDNGRQLAEARTAIFTGLVRHWAAEQHRMRGYDRPFAVVALGGTGRGEVTPRSDLDFALLFDDALEENAFLLELQKQLIHTDEFKERHGFACPALPFNLDALGGMEERQLNSFLDLRPVYDPGGLAGMFRERLRATFDPFEHWLHVRSFWVDRLAKAAGDYERVDRFDIKNEGLRVFLAAIWIRAAKDFRHSHDIYAEIEDTRDLAAYHFLLRLRMFIHLRRGGTPLPAPDGNHPEDVLHFDDFNAFGELAGPEAGEHARFEFANATRARLLAARRRVAAFAKSVIERELLEGREVSPGGPIVHGLGGLFHRASHECRTPVERSRAALTLLHAAQRYEVPISPTELQATFRNAGDWLVPVPELSTLFHEPRGSLAGSLAFLSQVEGAEERLFPGYAAFESSFDERVMKERQSTRGALMREKLRALEALAREGRARLADARSSARPAGEMAPATAAVEAALLEPEHLAAVKLALATKRLPRTREDEEMRADTGRPLHERFSTGFSNLAPADYYRPFVTQAGFTETTAQAAAFLVVNRRVFKDLFAAGPNDAEQVAQLLRLCGDEHRLRALFVFTWADRAHWESQAAQPARWFHIRELYRKALEHFHPAPDAGDLLRAAGFSREEQAILRGFGPALWNGEYRWHARRFGSHLIRLVEEPETTGPRAMLLRDGSSLMLGVVARDYRGLAATITGALWRLGTGLGQAHLFSAAEHGLALDFFHLAPGTLPPPELTGAVETAIRHRLHIGDADEAALPGLRGAVTLREWRPGRHCLRFESVEDAPGLVYALAWQVFRHLRASIFALTAHAARGRAYVTMYLSLPPEMTFAEAQAIAAAKFRG